jgi:hypothetical protein
MTTTMMMIMMVIIIAFKKRSDTPRMKFLTSYPAFAKFCMTLMPLGRYVIFLQESI